MAPSVFVAVLHRQAVGLCCLFESPVVVCVPPAAILYAVFIVEVVYHFVKQGRGYFLNRPCQRSRAYVDFVGAAQLANPCIITEGEMTVCAGG